jgi:hypothetical protein
MWWRWTSWSMVECEWPESKADSVDSRLPRGVRRAYAAEIALGTPGQPGLAVLDTGSGIIHVPCSGCQAADKA